MSPIEVIQADITTLEVDAIVNAANETLLGGGGVDGAIHRAAGPELLAACEKIPETRPGVRCPTGEARITAGFKLPARHVIHTVGPVWHGGNQGEDERLASCYRDSLLLAREHKLRSIAFPAISCGVYRFPPARAARIAVDHIGQHAADNALPARILLCALGADIAAQLRAALANC